VTITQLILHAVLLLRSIQTLNTAIWLDSRLTQCNVCLSSCCGSLMISLMAK